VLDVAIASRERHERFVQRVVSAGEVWGLRHDEDGAAVSTSNENEERGVVLFWSDRAYAAQCAREEWAEYGPVAIPLDGFLDVELGAVAEAGFLVGTNWNAHLVGLEVEPLDLLAELRAELEATRA
jgi:hypothetical protein